MTDLSTMLTAPKLKPQFNRWGQYEIPHPTTGEPQGWRRVSTVAKAIDDGYGLARWKERMTAGGMGRRPDLFALAASTDLEDKSGLDDIVKQALGAADSARGANLGTALHAFTERLDRGETVHAPSPWDRDIEAYRLTLEHGGFVIKPTLIERVVTLVEYGVAGQFDRLLEHRQHGDTLFVGDLKTSKDDDRTGRISDLSWLAFAIQFALYAHGDTMFDLATGKHLPMPPVNLERAVMIHLPAGKGRCDLYWVDIVAGWEAAKLAIEVIETRKASKKWAALIEAPKNATKATGYELPVVALSESPSCSELEDSATSLAGSAALIAPTDGREAADPAAISALRERVLRIDAAGYGNQLRHYWLSAAPSIKDVGFTQAHLETVGRLCADIEREHSLPWPAANEAPEYVAADDPQVVELIERLKALPRDLSGRIATQVKDKGWPKLTSGRLTPTQLAYIAEYVTNAQRAARTRLNVVSNLIVDYGDDCGVLVDLAAGEGAQLDRLTAADVDRLEMIVQGIDRLMLAFTYDGERPVLMSTERAEAEILARHESKMKAVSAAREEAGRRKRAKPRTMKELTADPVLVAALTLPGMETK